MIFFFDDRVDFLFDLELSNRIVMFPYSISFFFL